MVLFRFSMDSRSMSLPLLIIPILVHVICISWSRWEVITTVKPFSLLSFIISSRTSLVATGSSPMVGSSRNTIWGSFIRVDAMPRRCFMPLLKDSSLESAQLAMPTRPSISPIRFSLSSLGWSLSLPM